MKLGDIKARRMLTTAALFSAVLAVSCATCQKSTTYAPKRADRTHLVMQNGKVFLTHGKKTIPADQSIPLKIVGGKHHHSFFGCDPQAAGYYDQAQEHFQTASNLSWVDDVYDCVTCGCGNSRLCGSLNATFFNLEHYNRVQGRAFAIDAVNRFNDVGACTGAPAPQPDAAATPTPGDALTTEPPTDAPPTNDAAPPSPEPGGAS